MSKAKITKISICLALVLALVGGGIVYYNVAMKGDASVTNEAAARDESVPDDGVVYIEPEILRQRQKLHLIL